MQTVTLDRPREEAGAIVRAAFKQTDAIRLYHVGENRATGKTGVRRVCWGERVVVEFAETREGGIEFTVRAEKEVRENVTADPEAVESAVLNQLVRADPEQDTTPTSEDSGEDTVGAGGSTDCFSDSSCRCYPPPRCCSGPERSGLSRPVRSPACCCLWGGSCSLLYSSALSGCS
jgi:hypothetical protein